MTFKALLLSAAVAAASLAGVQPATAATTAMRITAVHASPQHVIAQGVVTFRVSLRGMRLDLRHMGKAPAAGHGHLQYYLERLPADAHTRRDLKHTFIAAVATREFNFNLQASRVKIGPGTHRILIALARNDDVLYRAPAAAVTITVK